MRRLNRRFHRRARVLYIREPWGRRCAHHFTMLSRCFEASVAVRNTARSSRAWSRHMARSCCHTLSSLCQRHVSRVAMKMAAVTVMAVLACEHVAVLVYGDGRTAKARCTPPCPHSRVSVCVVLASSFGGQGQSRAAPPDLAASRQCIRALRFVDLYLRTRA